MAKDINAPSDESEEPTEQAQADQDAAADSPAVVGSDQPSEAATALSAPEPDPEPTLEPARSVDQRHPDAAQGGR